MALIDKLRDRARAFANGGTPSLDKQQMDFLDEAADLGKERLDGYDLYERVYAGDVGVPLLDRAKEYLQRSGLPFTENFTETIVLAHKRRLKVEGFQVEDDEPASEWLSKTWFGRKKMTALQGVVHLETLKLGDGFVIGDWDSAWARPRFTWNHPSKIKPVYDDDGEDLLYVVKVWPTSKVSPQNTAGRVVRRMNLYFPDRIEKWFSPSMDRGGLWAPWVEDAAQGWPTPWTRNMQWGGDPLGINVFHFKEQPGAGLFGRSILRGVIPQQDGLDKQSADLFYVMDQMGWPWPYVAGLSEQQQKALKMAIGDILLLPEGATVGSLTPADPTKLNASIESILARMAARSFTPLHELIVGGDQPSGESRKVAESGIVAASYDRHTYLGGTWEDCSRYADLLQDVFGEGAPGIDPDAEIDAVWDSPETRDEKLEGESLLIDQELGASRASTLRKRGYDPDEEARLRAEEAKADPLMGQLITPPGGADEEDEQD